MDVNEYLILAILFVSFLSEPKHSRILGILCSITLCQVIFYHFNFVIYKSAFVADYLVLYAAIKERTKLSFRIAVISLCFMLSHLYGYVIYTLYIYPTSYDNLLSCLYVILLFELIINGGLFDGIKRLVKHFCYDIAYRASWTLHLQQGHRK